MKILTDECIARLKVLAEARIDYHKARIAVLNQAVSTLDKEDATETEQLMAKSILE